MRFHNAATIRSRLQRALIPYRSAAVTKVVKDVSLGVNLPDVIRNGSPSRFERLTAINHYLARQGESFAY